MKKIILDFNGLSTADEIHNYMAKAFCFPEYYGKNLDALHDCLTEISEPTCVGVFNTQSKYLKKVAQVFQDSEEENPYISFIYQDLEQNLA